MKIQQIIIDEIDLEDRKFIFTYDDNIGKLFTSIKKVGLLNPPILRTYTSHSRYQVITGYRRILACKKLGWRSILSQCYDSDEIDDLTAFLFNLFDNLCTRNFNPIERSVILSKLVNDFKFDEKEVIQNYLPIIGLNPHKNVLADYLCIMDLEDRIKKDVASEFIPVMTAVRLVKLSPHDRIAVFKLIKFLNLGTNKQKELITYSEEISEIYNIRIVDLLTSDDIRLIFENKDLTVPQKADEVRWFLRKKRFPRLTKAETRFADKRKSLNLDSKVSLSHSPFFEDEMYKMEFRFKNKIEFEEIVKNLNEVTNIEEITDSLD